MIVGKSIEVGVEPSKAPQDVILLYNLDFLNTNINLIPTIDRCGCRFYVNKTGNLIKT